MKPNTPIRLPALFVAYIVIAVGCANVPPTAPVRVGGLVFHNNTLQPLQDVQLQVPKTGRFITCNLILPGRQCATTFPSRLYRGTPVIITWRQAGKRFSSGKIRIQSRRKSAPGKAATVYATMNSDGSVEAKVK